MLSDFLGKAHLEFGLIWCVAAIVENSTGQARGISGALP
jgi:hypothetical protein